MSLPGDPADAQVPGWIAGVRAGDPKAAEALVMHLYPAVIQVVRRRLPDRLDEEDAAQEVFLRLFRKLDQFRGGPDSLVRWTRRLAFTTCLNLIRHERRRPEVRWSDLGEAETAVLARVVTPDWESAASAERESARELVGRLLAGLPAADRWLIEMLEIEERSVDEVRELTGWSGVGVRVRAHRARRKLQQAMRRLMNHQEEP
ncbi:MAG: sigma-70 family RNA polymerase sigma factor [Verrucomicrobiae bacterium]|nr:sigma-70 family RNA polymerase sigma factor [Verrucomicrobiae bacterium]MCP5520070.1 sigma-70 family RNA polymerase sigma factor [Verrucomicrobiales bacterium]